MNWIDHSWNFLFSSAWSGKEGEKTVTFIQKYIIKICFLPKKVFILISVSLTWAGTTHGLFDKWLLACVSEMVVSN